MIDDSTITHTIMIMITTHFKVCYHNFKLHFKQKLKIMFTVTTRNWITNSRCCNAVLNCKLTLQTWTRVMNNDSHTTKMLKHSNFKSLSCQLEHHHDSHPNSLEWKLNWHCDCSSHGSSTPTHFWDTTWTGVHVTNLQFGHPNTPRDSRICPYFAFNEWNIVFDQHYNLVTYDSQCFGGAGAKVAATWKLKPPSNSIAGFKFHLLRLVNFFKVSPCHNYQDSDVADRIKVQVTQKYICYEWLLIYSDCPEYYCSCTEIFSSDSSTTGNDCLCPK
jgi:hypothetical protein